MCTAQIQADDMYIYICVCVIWVEKDSPYVCQDRDRYSIYRIFFWQRYREIVVMSKRVWIISMFVTSREVDR